MKSGLEDCYRIRIAAPRQPLGVQQHGVQRQAWEQRFIIGNPILVWMHLQRERFIAVREGFGGESTEQGNGSGLAQRSRERRERQKIQHRGHRGKPENTEKDEPTAEAQRTLRKPGEIPACGKQASAGLKHRRRPPFAKALRASRTTMLVASSEKRRAQARLPVPRCRAQRN